MGALKRIWRAIFEDDGAPSMFSGLVAGSSQAGNHVRAVRPGVELRQGKAPAVEPVKR